MLKTIFIFSFAIHSLSAADSKKESDTAKLNRKFVEHMKLIEQFAIDSRKMHQKIVKAPDLTKTDKENIKKMEKENQKLLEQVKENIKKVEAQD